jgi:hypothetical protein
LKSDEETKEPVKMLSNLIQKQNIKHKQNKPRPSLEG